MDDITTLGAYLRAERERRGLTLKTISEATKVSFPLLEGLESDDISRWPGGIFRRAFVRSYADAVGLDPDAVLRRFEQQHRPAQPEVPLDSPQAAVELAALEQAAGAHRPVAAGARAVPRPLSWHRRRPHRRPGPRLRQRRCRVAAVVAGADDCGVLRDRRAADRYQSDGCAALAGRGARRPRPRESQSDVDPFLDHSSAAL